MTRYGSGPLGRLLKSAVLCAALFVCATKAVAEDITLRSAGGGLAISGRFIGFDGEFVEIDSQYGPVTMRLSAVSCEGKDCPDLDGYVPTLRFSGAARMANVLLPALVRGFARSTGLSVDSNTENDTLHLELSDDDKPTARFVFSTSNTDEGFADLISHEADIVMSVREVRKAEIARAIDAGIGQLDNAKQSRIVALDALVPVVPPQSKVFGLSLAQLAGIYSGEITNWSTIGGADLPIVALLGDQSNGMAQRFVDGVVTAAGSVVSDTVTRISQAELATKLTQTSGGIAVLPFRQTGNGRAVALRDLCGFISIPDTKTLKTEDYPLTAPLFLYLPARRLPQVGSDFLAWLRSPQAQLVVRRAGFVDQGAVPIPLDSQGQRFANAIAAAGDDMPLTELKRMVRVLGKHVRLSTSFRFEVGSTRLDAQSRSNLLTLAQAISDGRYKGETLLFVGFSDGRGSADANRKLSAARAEAVSRNLTQVSGGKIPTSVTIDTAAFGEALPLGCDDTEWGRQMNRRVELWIAQ